MSKKKLFAKIAGGLVVLVVLAVVVIEVKVGVLFAAPEASLDSVVKADTRAQLVLDPRLAKDFVTKLALRNPSLPPWAIPYVLPYKLAVAVNPDPVLGKINLGFMINAPRFGGPLCKQINATPLNTPLLKWFAKPMEIKQRGLLVREGGSDIDAAVASEVKKVWEKSSDNTPCSVTGQHAAELLVDLRDGAALTALLSLIEQFPKAANTNYVLLVDKLQVLTHVTTLRMQADVDNAGTLTLHVEFACGPETDENMRNVIRIILDMGVTQIKRQIEQSGIELQSKIETNEKSVTADFTAAKFTDWALKNL